MPYYKRYKRKPTDKYYSYKQAKPKRPYFGRLDLKAYGLAKKALSMINSESKIIDTTATVNPSSDAPIVNQNLINLVQGTTDNTRVGDQIRLKNINIRLILKKASAATDTIVRIMLILDKQPNGANIAAASLLKQHSSYPITSPLHEDYVKRYRVLASRLVTLNADFPEKVIKIFKKVGFRVRYSANAGTVADIVSNNVSLFITADETTASGNQPSIKYFSRVRYIDN